MAAAAGRVDVLVNNAGMSVVGAPEVWAPLHRLPLDAWLAGIDRNLSTAVHMTRAVLPGLYSRGWGRIVTVASTRGTSTRCPTRPSTPRPRPRSWA